MGKILILSVGINKYPKLPEESQLNYCANDAEVIHDKYSQFNCLYQKLLLDQKATRTEILKRIEDINRVARDEDYVVFNFAGHGFTTELENDKINSKNSFICPYDFEADYCEQTAINLFTLNAMINQINANSKLIIFDACHSGGALRRKLSDSKLREIKIDKLIDIIGNNNGTGILTACNSDELAQEDHKIQHGIFTYNLVKTLEEIDSEDYLAPFDEVYSTVLDKVRGVTKNEQNPQAKKSDDNFKILTIHKAELTGTKSIQLDTSIIPTSKIHQPSEQFLPEVLDDFEVKIIQLIQEGRFIEIDLLFKDEINKVFNKISEPEVPLSANSSDAIPYYESCREHLKPLLILINYILNYSEQKYIIENLEYIFQFETLVRGKSGTVAIIEIPITLISEIFFYLMPIAYKKRYAAVLKKLFTVSTTSYQGQHSIPFIYDTRIWHPELFKRSVSSYFECLISKDTKNDLTLNSKIQNLNEIIFLFDCYSSVSDGEYVSFPTYLLFNDITTPNRILSKMSDPDFISFIEDLFSIKIKDFINLIITRQKQISNWHDISFEIKMKIPDYIAGYEKFSETLD